jgi:hypothetical protein
MTEHSLKAQLENALKEQEAAQHKSSTTAPEITGNALVEAESLINMKSNDLEKKMKELVCPLVEYFFVGFEYEIDCCYSPTKTGVIG